jgi:hypothetical protein
LIAFDVALARGACRADPAAMPSFAAFATSAPELAREVRARLDARVHKTLATLRADGAPRISGTETRHVDGELWIGSMWQARRARDLRRDPRFALHSGSDDPPAWTGDAKLAGVAVEEQDPEEVARVNGPDVPPGPAHAFRLDVREVSVVRMDADGGGIHIDLWTPDEGVRRIVPPGV